MPKKQKPLRRVLLDNRLSTSFATYGRTPSRVVEVSILLLKLVSRIILEIE